MHRSGRRDQFPREQRFGRGSPILDDWNGAACLPPWGAGAALNPRRTRRKAILRVNDQVFGQRSEFRFQASWALGACRSG